MKYLLSTTKLINYFFLLAMFSPEIINADELSKESLKSAIENQIRSARERNKRLKYNELLDENSKFYYDGDNAYPGIIIEGVVFPALIKANNRYPGCLVGAEIIEGKYESKSKKVICELYFKSGFEQGETIIIQSSKGATTEKFTKAFGEKPSSYSAVDTRRAKKTVDKRKYKASNPVKSLGKLSKINKNKPITNVDNAASNDKTVLEVNAFNRKAKFGVRAGTWGRVFLPRTVSSSERARIELELVEEINGLYRDIPLGTIFFANHKINPSTQRLDMDAILMVLPDGSEYPISATIHSNSMASGLAGALITHSDKIVGVTAKRNILESTANVIAENTNPAATIAGNVAIEVLDAQEKSLPFIPQYSVQVASQEGLIRFGRSF